MLKELYNKAKEENSDLVICDYYEVYDNEKIYEDMATMPILIGYINKVSYLKKPLYNYIIRTGSTMRQQTYNKKIESIFVAIDYLLKEFKERKLNEKYSEELEYIVIEHLLYAGTGRFLQYEEQ